MEGTKQAIVNEFARISPIAWGHLTFTGRYNFKNIINKINLEKMIDSLEEKLLQPLLNTGQKF